MTLTSSRFVHPYYLLNGLLFVSYFALRLKRLSPGELSREDMFGITRETQIYICVALMLFSRSLSAPTLDAYLSSAFMFTRVGVLLCLWYMEIRLLGVFAALWTLLYAICPQPRYRLPDSVVTLNNVSYNERIAKNKHKTIYVLWCHATWSARCSQLAPVLATLAKSYKHPRVRFARLDIAKFPTVAEGLGVSVSAASKQLPTVVCFKMGKEVARIPKADSAGNVPKQWSRGFTAAHVAKELQLNVHFQTAKQWEKEAQERYKGTKKTK